MNRVSIKNWSQKKKRDKPIKPNFRCLLFERRSYKSWLPSLMLIGIDSSPCSLSLRNRSKLCSTTKCHQNKLDLKNVFVQKSFFFNIFYFFNPNHAYWNQRWLFSGILLGMFQFLQFVYLGHAHGAAVLTKDESEEQPPFISFGQTQIIFQMFSSLWTEGRLCLPVACFIVGNFILRFCWLKLWLIYYKAFGNFCRKFLSFCLEKLWTLFTYTE